MEKSEINTVQWRRSSHIQSYYTIISVTVNDARLEKDRGRGERFRRTGEKKKRGGKMQKRECGSWREWGQGEREGRRKIKKHTWTQRDRGEWNGRGYYGKEVNLAVMLCLVEKKTGFFLCVCVTALCYLSLSLCMCTQSDRHLPTRHHIGFCKVCAFVLCV